MRNEADSDEPDTPINWSNSEFPGPWQRLRWERLQRQVRRGELPAQWLESPRKSVGRSLCHRYHPALVSLHQALLTTNEMGCGTARGLNLLEFVPSGRTG